MTGRIERPLADPAMRRCRTAVGLSLAVLWGCAGDAARVDLLMVGGAVYTLEWPEADAADGRPNPASSWTEAHGWRPAAEAVAIREGRIVWVGSSADARPWRERAERVIELNGAAVVPGLSEAHVHAAELGAALARVDLVGVTTEVAAVDRVAARAASVPAGNWILGQGWDEGAWADRYPDLTLLSERVPDHPVLLRGLHGFAAWGNRAAFAAAGITARTADPVGGTILRTSTGEPAGVVLNRAVPLLEAAVPAASPATRDAELLDALETLARAGYTGVHEAGATAATLGSLTRLEAAGTLPVRVHAMLSGRDTTLLREWLDRGPDTTGLVRVRTVKAYYDGALGSRGAALLEDYSDAPGERGLGGAGYGFDAAWTARMARAGFQLAIHAIGDAGNRAALDLIEGSGDRTTVRAAHHRIEHAQVISPEDVSRFAELGVIASMQPAHAVEDMPWAEARVGRDRIAGAYAWRTLREAGVTLLFSSDLPGSDHDFFYGLHSAVTRRNRAGEPPAGWRPAEALTVEEAVRAWTGAAAFAEFREDHAGAITVGRVADLTVLTPDPFTSEPDRWLADGRILYTVVDGRIVFAAADR